MRKKNTAMVFLIIAYAVLLCHSIIPHHHHDNEIVFTGQYDDKHYHDDDHDCHSAFSLWRVDDNFLIPQSHFNLSKILVSLVFLFPDNYTLSEIKFSCPREKFSFVEESPPRETYYPDHSHRGPPLV